MHKKAVVPYVFLIILVLTLFLVRYEVPQAKAALVSFWGWREHRSYAPVCDFTFAKSDATTVRMSSTHGSMGDCYMITNRLSVDLNNTFFEITWQMDFSYEAPTAWIEVYDGIYDRSNNTQWPTGGWPLGLPPPLWQDSESDASIGVEVTKRYGPAIMAYTETNSTIVVRFWDAWSGHQGWLDVDKIVWIDTNNVTVLETHDFTGDVTMEVTGSDGDYGYITADANPTYSDISTNTTIAGDPVAFNCKWTDDVGLAGTGGYIFGTNNTGTFTNQTWSAFSSNPDWANVTSMTLNSTIGLRIEYRWWANDTSNNWGDTGIQSLVTVSNPPPTYSDVSTNTSQPGQPCNFYTLWTDNVNMSGYIFGTNNTGTFTNETWTGWSPTGTPLWSNTTKTLNATTGLLIQWQYWANDTSNVWNTTGIQTVQESRTSEYYSTLDGYVWSTNATYNFAWNTSSGVDPTGLPIGQRQNGGYSIYRGFIRFDTSGISDRATITGGILSLYGSSDSSATDFTINIQEWTGAADGLSEADFNANGSITYDDGAFSTTAWAVGSYNNITFSNLTIINAVGYTDLVIRSSRDIAQTTPTGLEFISAHDNEEGPGYWPILYVTYLVGPNAIPTIGEFQPLGTIQQNGNPFFLNCTVNDDDGVNDITYVWIAIDDGIFLSWANVTDTFVEERDDGGYCTLDTSGSNRTTLNATAITFAWRITLSAAYPVGNVSVLITGTNATDGLETVWGSYATLFTFRLKEWLVAETWVITLQTYAWEIVEQWIVTIIPKAWVLVEEWMVWFGIPIIFSTATLRAMLLIGGLGMVFLPVFIMIKKRPHPKQIVILFMILIIGFALILGFIYMV